MKPTQIEESMEEGKPVTKVFVIGALRFPSTTHPTYAKDFVTSLDPESLDICFVPAVWIRQRPHPHPSPMTVVITGTITCAVVLHTNGRIRTSMDCRHMDALPRPLTETINPQSDPSSGQLRYMIDMGVERNEET